LLFARVKPERSGSDAGGWWWLRRRHGSQLTVFFSHIISAVLHRMPLFKMKKGVISCDTKKKRAGLVRVTSQPNEPAPSASAALVFSSELAKQPKKKKRNPKPLLQSLLAGIRNSGCKGVGKTHTARTGRQRHPLADGHCWLTQVETWNSMGVQPKIRSIHARGCARAVTVAKH
jgi:hypothetical protein